jgi:hypothetical protein
VNTDSNQPDAPAPLTDALPRSGISSRRWAIIAIASLVVAIACGLEMARRVRAFHRENPREVYAFRRVNDREFTYAGRPVSFTDDRSNPLAPQLLLAFGDQTRRLNVEVPNTDAPARDKLPGLEPHVDWLRVLRMTRADGIKPEVFAQRLAKGELPDRLIIVTRIPRPGSDPATWGSVWKKDWQFDFFELLPDGTIAQYERLKYPTTRGVRRPKAGELHENTWQFQAALQLMPQAGKIGPTHNFFGNAIAAAGWTLPIGAFSGLLCTVATVFALAPRKRGGRSWRAKR